LEKAPNLQKLNSFFQKRSYYNGATPTLRDAVEFESDISLSL